MSPEFYLPEKQNIKKGSMKAKEITHYAREKGIGSRFVNMKGRHSVYLLAPSGTQRSILNFIERYGICN